MCGVMPGLRLLLCDMTRAPCRERALAKVKVAKDDIAVLNAETEWGLDRSEMFLREHGGDVAAALRSFARPTAEQ